MRESIKQRTNILNNLVGQDRYYLSSLAQSSEYNKINM